MTEPYAAVEPYESGSLEIGDGHTVYWESVGGARGRRRCMSMAGRVTAAHRGRGATSTPTLSGRSCSTSVARPEPSVGQRWRHRLVHKHHRSRFERLRGHLGVDRWVVVGVSWGVTLGLVYAQTHPERVAAMVLGAVTTGTRREIDWITPDMGRVFPREWEAFAGLASAAGRRGGLSAAYARLLADPDVAVREAALGRGALGRTRMSR